MKAQIDGLKSTLSWVATRLRGLKPSLAAALLLLGSATLCQGQVTSAVTVTAQNLWTNQVIYTLETNPVALSGCGKQSVTAAAEIEAVEEGVSVTYQFLFWDVNAQLHTNPTVIFQPVCGAANSAIAVYWPLGGCAGCPPATTDAVLAFSLNSGTLIAGATPIASASSGWTAGSLSVTPPSTIEALTELPPYGKWKGWDILGQPYTLATSLSLTEPAGSVVLGFYGYPDPDPCQSLRNELENASCDGLNPTQCEAYLRFLHEQLQQCEITYGEQ